MEIKERGKMDKIPMKPTAQNSRFAKEEFNFMVDHDTTREIKANGQFQLRNKLVGERRLSIHS